MPSITFATGNGVHGYDEPTKCHSSVGTGHQCYAVSGVPGRTGWAFVTITGPEARRNGWWCPDCVRQLKELCKANGFVAKERDYTVRRDGGTA